MRFSLSAPNHVFVGGVEILNFDFPFLAGLLYACQFLLSDRIPRDFGSGEKSLRCRGFGSNKLRRRFFGCFKPVPFSVAPFGSGD